MRPPGTAEIIIVLVIVVLLFGVGRISKIAGELGRGIKEFRKGLSEEQPTEVKDQTEPKNEA